MSDTRHKNNAREKTEKKKMFRQSITIIDYLYVYRVRKKIVRQARLYFLAYLCTIYYKETMHLNLFPLDIEINQKTEKCKTYPRGHFFGLLVSRAVGHR